LIYIRPICVNHIISYCYLLSDELKLVFIPARQLCWAKQVAWYF